MATIAYLRVSTDKQTLEKELVIDRWVEEIVSGKVILFAFGLATEIERNLIPRGRKKPLPPERGSCAKLCVSQAHYFHHRPVPVVNESYCPVVNEPRVLLPFSFRSPSRPLCPFASRPLSLSSPDAQAIITSLTAMSSRHRLRS